MSKVQQNYSWLKTKVNSAKTAIAQAERGVPHFKEHMAKFNEQVNPKKICPKQRYQLQITQKTMSRTRAGKNCPPAQ